MGDTTSTSITPGPTPSTKCPPRDLTDCAITLAVAAYVVADLPIRIGQ